MEPNNGGGNSAAFNEFLNANFSSGSLPGFGNTDWGLHNVPLKSNGTSVTNQLNGFRATGDAVTFIYLGDGKWVRQTLPEIVVRADGSVKYPAHWGDGQYFMNQTASAGNANNNVNLNAGNQGGGSWVDGAQMALDGIGMTEIPFVSQGAELISAGISAYNGDYTGAAIGLGSMIPLGGKVFEGMKAR